MCVLPEFEDFFKFLELDGVFACLRLLFLLIVVTCRLITRTDLNLVQWLNRRLEPFRRISGSAFPSIYYVDDLVA